MCVVFSCVLFGFLLCVHGWKVTRGICGMRKSAGNYAIVEGRKQIRTLFDRNMAKNREVRGDRMRMVIVIDSGTDGTSHAIGMVKQSGSQSMPCEARFEWND